MKCSICGKKITTTWEYGTHFTCGYNKANEKKLNILNQQTKYIKEIRAY